MRYRVLKDCRGVSGKTVDMEVRGRTYIIDPCGNTMKSNPEGILAAPEDRGSGNDANGLNSGSSR